MSSGRTAPRRTRRRNQARGKWIVAALLIVALFGTLLARWNRPLETNAPSVSVGNGDLSDLSIVENAEAIAEDTSEGIGDVTDVVESGAISGANSVADAVDGATDIAAIPVTIREPSVTNAVVGYDADGNEFLTVSGSADERCQSIRFLLDGNDVGSTAPDPDGSWALTLSNVPEPGSYMSEIECEADNGIYTAAPRAFEFQGPPPQVVAEDVTDSAEIPTAGTPEVIQPANEQQNDGDAVVEAEVPAGSDPATNPDDNQAEADLDNNGEGEAGDGEEGDVDSAEIPAADQPTFFLAQDMEKFVGGPIQLRGDAAPGTVVEIVFDNGSTRIVDTARTDDKGDWRYRGALFEPGTYQVSAQLPGTTAQPLQQIIVPNGLDFGSKGNCVGKIPPFGTITDNAYTVNFCEYFSLIADRLGVSFGELQAANPQIVNLDYLAQGDILNIPETP